LANAVEKRLHDINCATYVLDGDNVRHGLCSDLGFSKKDREENIRRIGEVSKLFIDAGIIAISAFISPFRKDRDLVRALIGTENFIEVYCSCSIEVCESRDVKGLYARARQGLINDFTGISSPYEPPLAAELLIETDELSLAESVDKIINFLQAHNLIALNRETQL